MIKIYYLDKATLLSSVMIKLSEPIRKAMETLRTCSLPVLDIL